MPEKIYRLLSHGITEYMVDAATDTVYHLRIKKD